MDKKYIEENEIEIRYLRNQLSDEELGEFEVYLMENPEMWENLAISKVLNHHTRSLTKNKFKVSKEAWFVIPAKLVLNFSLLLVFISSSFIFASFYNSDSELELYAVRGENESIPTLTLTTGQKLWPLMSKVTLRAQVADSRLFSIALLERLQPRSCDYQIVGSYSDLRQLDGGDLAVDVELSHLVEGRYRVVLRQNHTANGDWIFSFRVK